MTDDSTVKAEPSPAAKYADADIDLGFNNPLLEKVRQLLISTDPDKWQIGGTDLTAETRVARPQAVHEQVLVRDIPNGSLVLHLLQPVVSQYMPGGYALNPNGPATYTIEVRDRIFDANKAVDPKFAGNMKGKRCEVVASGDIAKSLFVQVRETIRTYNKDCKKTFDQKVAELLPRLSDKIESSGSAAWAKESAVEKEEQIVSYSGEVDGLKVKVERRTKDWQPAWSVTVSNDKFSHSQSSQSAARVAFDLLEKMEQDLQLTKLADRLKDLGL